MIPEEFKTQVFKTPKQWGSGLFYRLDALEKGGITLYPTPGLAQWIIQTNNGINNPVGLAVDKCGQIYLFDSDLKSNICKLYRYDCGTKNLEQLSYIDRNSCLNNEQYPKQNIQCPQRILLSKRTLWVNDTLNKRVLVFSRKDYQVKNIIDKLNDGKTIEPIDIGLDECGHIYVLIKRSNNYQVINYQIVKYDNCGDLINSFDLPNTTEAIGLASGTKNVLYLIENTKENIKGSIKKLVKYTENKSHLNLNFSIDLSEDDVTEIQRSGIVVDKKGNIFISDCKKGIIHQFDPDGNSLGIVKGITGTIQGLAVDLEGNLFVSSNKGICKLDSQNTFTREIGTYYSKTLDSGIKECQWHRIVLEADMFPKTAVEISYSSSDDDDLKKEIDEKIGDKTISKKEKANYLDIHQKLKWSKPEQNPRDMLFREKTGRYLWLKVILSTFDEKVKPTITQMRIHYPRISYLHYLPAIYQEDPISKEFLERFLSIFETAADNLENTISHMYKYFDPDIVPQDFINWLASWLNIALEEDWKEEKKRQFIQEAYSLYKQKGTPSGIEKLIEIYTGKKPVLLEHSQIEKPIILNENGTFRLGVNTLLVELPIRGFILGDEAILGRVAFWELVRSPEDPFLLTAYRFTIILDLSDEEKNLYEKQLIRILDEVKPAHTVYDLRFSSSMRETGTYVGSTKLEYNKPLRLGAEATIGSVIVITDGEKGGRMGQYSVVGVDAELI